MYIHRGKLKKEKASISPPMREVIRAAKRARRYMIMGHVYGDDGIEDRIYEELDLVIDLVSGRLRNMEVSRRGVGKRWMSVST